MVDMSSLKVLVVDDDRLISWALSRELESRRIDRQIAGTGEECREEIGKADYDLAFLDVHLPDANGIDLLREIRQRSPRTKVVVVSADGTSQIKKSAIEGGAIQFLEKPFDLSLVERIIQSAFGEYLEPRKSERYYCNLRMWVQPAEAAPVEEPDETDDLFGIAEDIGPLGVRISTTSPLRMQQVVRLKTTGNGDVFMRFLPENGEAVVRWVTSRPGGFMAGLQYVTPAPAASPDTAASRS